MTYNYIMCKAFYLHNFSLPNSFVFFYSFFLKSKVPTTDTDV